MSRGGRIGGGNRRHRKPFGLPLRPTRWISGADFTVEPCIVKSHALFDPTSLCQPRAVELVQGSTDLEVIDRQEVTVTRVVGQIDVRYSQLVDTASPSYQLPCVRFGMCTVDSDIAIGSWTAPDLFDDATLEEVNWMWLNQLFIGAGGQIAWSPELSIPGGGFNRILEAHGHIDVDCGVNRKIGRDGHLMLVGQVNFQGPPVESGANIPLVTYVEFLRVLMKC